MDKQKTIEVNHRYLVDYIQISEHSYWVSINCITIIEETQKAYKILFENGGSYWVLKKWRIDVFEDLGVVGD